MEGRFIQERCMWQRGIEIMNNGIFACDDLIPDIPIDKELLKEKFPIETKGKVISGTFGSFNINKIPESLIKMEFDEDIKAQYQMEPINPKCKPYRCISHNMDFPFGVVVDIELSVSVSGRMIVAKSPYKNKFKKTYKDYREFLTEWEEVD